MFPFKLVYKFGDGKNLVPDKKSDAVNPENCSNVLAYEDAKCDDNEGSIITYIYISTTNTQLINNIFTCTFIATHLLTIFNN